MLLITSFSHMPQGSTFLYKTYVEPYLVQNESEIDASIASARNETLQFLQTRLSALWDILYSLLSRTPVTPKLSPSGVTPANGAPLDPNALFQSVQGLWGSIAPPNFLATSAPHGGKPTTSRSASHTVVSEKQAPFSGPPTDGSAGVGYDVGETIKD